MKQIDNILIINRMGIGDVVVTTPLAQMLKEEFGCRVGMLVAPKAIDIISNHPYIDDTFTYHLPSRKIMLEQIRGKKYKNAVIADERLSSTLVALQAGCRLLNKGFEMTIGRHRLFCRKPRALRATMDYADYVRCLDEKMVPRALGPTVGRLEDAGKQKVLSWLQENGFVNKKFVLIVPRGVAGNKNWPIDYFQYLNEFLSGQNIAPVYLGALSDKDYIEQIGGNKINTAGCFGLREVAFLAGHAAATLTPCTGTMHIISAAADSPVIALYGPSDFRRWAPEKALVLKADLPCVPCARLVCQNKTPLECMKAITPDKVIAALRQYI